MSIGLNINPAVKTHVSQVLQFSTDSGSERNNLQQTTTDKHVQKTKLKKKTTFIQLFHLHCLQTESITSRIMLDNDGDSLPYNEKKKYSFLGPLGLAF